MTVRIVSPRGGVGRTSLIGFRADTVQKCTYRGIQWSAALLLTSQLAGCSVGMAISGKPEPRLELLHVGMAREHVEGILGQPVETAQTKDGYHTAVYVYTRGNEPSAGRAIFNLVMDGFTLLLWEIPATAAEASRGEARRYPVVYDSEDKAVALNDYGNL